MCIPQRSNEMRVRSSLSPFALQWSRVQSSVWPKVNVGPEISFSLVHSGNNSGSQKCVRIVFQLACQLECSPLWTVLLYPRHGEFWVEQRLGRDENRPWQIARTNPPTHTLKTGWPHEHRVRFCTWVHYKFWHLRFHKWNMGISSEIQNWRFTFTLEKVCVFQ